MMPWPLAEGAAAGCRMVRILDSASRRDGDGLSDDCTAAGVFTGLFLVGFDHQSNGFAKVRPSFFEGSALGVGTGKLLNEGDVAFRNPPEHRGTLEV